MTYSINALIEYDYEELNKYGLSIQNVSIECSEYGSFFSITGDLIITDSKTILEEDWIPLSGKIMIV